MIYIKRFFEIVVFFSMKVTRLIKPLTRARSVCNGKQTSINNCFFVNSKINWICCEVFFNGCRACFNSIFCFQSKLVFTLLVFKWCYFAMCWGISVQKEGGWLPFLKISKKNSIKSENIIRNWNCVFFLCPMQLSSFCVGQHLSSKRIFLNFFVRKKVVIMLFVQLMDGRFVI
jgi:hypothetical protein